jgi:hypothetical protein
MTGHNNLYPYLLKITNASKFRNFAKKLPEKMVMTSTKWINLFPTMKGF